MSREHPPLLEEIEEVEIKWIVFSADGKRAAEAEESSELFLENTRKKNIVIKQFRESFFPYIGFIHGDKPLRSRSKNNRFFAAPAMRIRMFHCVLCNEKTIFLQPGDDIRIGFEYKLTVKKIDLFCKAAVVIYR